MSPFRKLVTLGLLMALPLFATSAARADASSPLPWRHTHHARRAHLTGRSLGLLFLLPLAAFGVVGEEASKTADSPRSNGSRHDRGAALGSSSGGVHEKKGLLPSGSP